MSRGPGSPEWLRALGVFGLIIADLVGFSCAGVGLGWTLYRYLGLPRLGIPVLGLLGLVLAFVQIQRVAKRLEGPPK